MSHYTTVNDLQLDALWRAGEPTDGSSVYATKALEYLNAAQMALVLGGPVGGLVLPVVDWWWARKNPRGVFNTVAEYSTGTAHIYAGASTIRFDPPPAISLQGYRVRVGTFVPVPRMITHPAGNAVAALDAAWPEPTTGMVPFCAFQVEYTLAVDFLRFCGQPTITDWPYKIDVVDEDVLEEAYPLTLISAGTPTVAALTGPQTIRFNHWTETAKRIEYPYIALPPDLVPGGTPVLPRHHRRILSTLAAAFILFDKADDKATGMSQEAQAYFRVMLQEHNHHMRRASQSFGRIEPRQDRCGGLLRTESGLIVG